MKPIRDSLWAASVKGLIAIVITSLFFAGIFVAVITFFVGYTNMGLPGSWLPLAAPVVVIPPLVYLWISAIKACFKKRRKYGFLEPQD